MNINSNEILFLNKMRKMNDGVNGVTNEDGEVKANVALNDNAPVPTEDAGMKALMFKGLKNVVSDPQLAQETGALKDTVANGEENEASAKEYVAPYSSNLSFQGKSAVSAKVRKYLAMAMAAFTLATTVPTMTSCGEDTISQSVHVELDLSVMNQLLAELQAMRQELASYNQANAAKMDQLIAMFNQLLQMAQKQQLSQESFQTLVLANQSIIIDLMVQQGVEQAEARKTLNAILSAVENGTMTIQQALQQISSLVSDIKALLKEAIAKLDEYAQKASAERQELIATNKAGFEQLIKTGMLTNEQLARLNASSDSLLVLGNKQIEAQENIKNAIVSANIDSNANFDTVVKTLNANKNDLIRALMHLGYTQAQIERMTAAQIIAAINENTAITQKGNELIAKISKQLTILPSLLQQGKITNAQLQQFYALYQEAVAAGGEFSEEMLVKLEQLSKQLDGIQETLDDMNATLKSMSKKLSSIESNEKYQTQLLGKLYQNEKFQTSILVNLDKTTKTMAADLAELKASTDDLITRVDEVLEVIKNSGTGSNISKEELEVILNKMGITIAQAMQMSSSEIIAAIRNFQNTYIVTEQKQTEEIQTVNAKLDDLQMFLLNNTTDNQGVINAIKDLTNAVQAGDADLSAKLQAIKTQLEKLQASVDAIFKQIGTIAAKADTYFSSWSAKWDTALGLLSGIDSKLSQIESNQKVAEKYLSYLLTEVKNIKLEIQKLQTIGGSNIDLDKLEEMWQEHDEANFEKYSKLIKELGIDTSKLTTIEALLTSIDAKMEYINNNSAILNQILAKLNGIDWTKPDYSAKLDKIIEILQNFKCNCECGGNNEGILGDIDKVLG